MCSMMMAALEPFILLQLLKLIITELKGLMFLMAVRIMIYWGPCHCSVGPLFRKPDSQRHVPLDWKSVCLTACYPENNRSLLQKYIKMQPSSQPCKPNQAMKNVYFRSTGPELNLFWNIQDAVSIILVIFVNTALWNCLKRFSIIYFIIKTDLHPQCRTNVRHSFS